MLQTETQARLYCTHLKPFNVDCLECRSAEKDYQNRALYAPLYVPLPNLPNAINNSQLKLPNAFYVPINNGRKNTLSNHSSSNDYVEMKTDHGFIRIPRAILVERSCSKDLSKNNNNILYETNKPTCDPQQPFPGAFRKHAHRYVRSFSWKTKPEEPPYAQMQPLPKLIKRPGHIEICFKNICWPTHQLCLCCTRNIADGCRKWSKSTGEYDYIDACWSSCALCSDDAYKILNTPIVYNEKIIDPEILLPLDAELLYYSIQSAKRQEENRQNISQRSIHIQQQPKTLNNQQDNVLPFSTTSNNDDSKALLSTSNTQENKILSDMSNLGAEEKSQQQSGTPTFSMPTKSRTELKPSRKGKSSASLRRKTSSNSKRATKSRRMPSNRPSRSRHDPRRNIKRSKSSSQRKSRSKTGSQRKPRSISGSRRKSGLTTGSRQKSRSKTGSQQKSRSRTRLRRKSRSKNGSQRKSRSKTSSRRTARSKSRSRRQIRSRN